ncbi:MAG: DNA alkylation repair protein [Candidatus Caldatribacteriota bacterium]
MDNLIIKEIKEEFKILSNQEEALRAQRYFKTGKGEYGEGDVFLGLKVPEIRRIAKKYSIIPLSGIIIFLQSEFHEERFFALLLLINHFQKGDEEDKKRVYNLYLNHIKYINNWDLVDISAGRIVGAYLFKRDKTPIYKLARAKNLWERRISIMSTAYFIAHNEFDDTLNIAEMLLTDKEDLIHKAVGWMLREVGKKCLEIEEDFLIKHHREMPRTMLRYAIEKFPEEKRKSYLIK